MDAVVKIPGLMRDAQTKMVINRDLSEYHKMLADRQNRENVECIRRDVDNITKELNNLKSLIYEFIKK